MENKVPCSICGQVVTTKDKFTDGKQYLCTACFNENTVKPAPKHLAKSKLGRILDKMGGSHK